MCDPVTLFAVGSSVVGAGGSLLGGNAKAKSLSKQADAEMRAAMDNAALVRQQAKEVKSSAKAAYASSGVDVNFGTPLITDAAITQKSEADAMRELMYGRNSAMALKDQASAARQSGVFDAFSSLLGGAASIWKGRK